jgi:hypothetical protein
MIALWHKFLASFHGSETIIWARVQYFFVLLLTAVNSVDLSPFITDRQLLVVYMLINAVVTEAVRKNREDWSGGVR